MYISRVIRIYKMGMSTNKVADNKCYEEKFLYCKLKIPW